MSLARRASSDSHHLRAAWGAAPAATVSSTSAERARPDRVAHLEVGEAPVGLQAKPLLGGVLRQRAAQLVHPLAARRHRHQVGLGEVAIVVRVRLLPAAGRDPGVLVPVPGLLEHLLPRVEHGGVPGHLVAHRALDRTERVDVLGLGASAQLARAAGGKRQVHVGAQVALVHPSLGDAEREDQVAQLLHVRASHVRSLRARTEDRLRHDLDQRDAGPVVVDERVVGAVDPTAGAHVGGLAGVLLHVCALDLDADGLAAHLHIHEALERDRLVVLAGLEVLRHVRVEVVLPREPAPLRDLAVERQPDPDRRLHGLAVDDRHRAGEPEAHRADRRVRLLAERRRAAAEHLGRGVELDVDLEPEGRVVALEHLLERHQGRGHADTSCRAGAWSSSGPPHWSRSSVSSAAPTR